MRNKKRAVLFDLDGTLADTAPDLALSLNRVLKEESRPEMSFDSIRPVVSHGGMALIKLGFKIPAEHPEFERLRQRLLTIYRDNICNKTTLFPGMDELLEALEKQHILWGVVTNKPAWLTTPLMEQLQLEQRAGSIVSGDTLKERKPHPAPLFHACQEMQVNSTECIYIGDAARDIEAGQRAGMKTVAALYGYIEEDDPPQQWNADIMITHPLEVLDHL